MAAPKDNDLLESFIDVYMNSLKYLDGFVSEPAKEFHLSFEQYLILHTVTQRQNVTLMDIADERQVTRSAISRQIKVLLKQDYIYQLPDENDRRRLYLKLTPAGKRAERVISERTRKRFQGWIDVFGEKRANDLLDFIRDFSAVNQLRGTDEAN